MNTNKIKLIAETAWHHEGDFDFINKLVTQIIKSSNADFIKLHLMLDFDEYIHNDHPLYKQIKPLLFSASQWDCIIKKICKSSKKLMLLFNDKKSIDFGMKYQPELVEIHSVCLNDIHLLNRLKDKINNKVNVVLGVGGSSLYEIENAIRVLDYDNIILMFGFQNYPTKYHDINFRKMQKIMKLYPEYEFGYADHTAWNEPDNILITLLGAALGMNYVEKHVTQEYGQERTDWQAAISIDMFNEIYEKLKILASCNGDGLLQLNAGEKKYSLFGPMKKAALLIRDVNKGDIFIEDMIAFKRTDQISDLSQVEVLERIGSIFSSDIKKDTVLISNHFQK